MSFLTGTDRSVSSQLFLNSLVYPVDDTGSLVADVVDRYCVRFQPSRRQIVSSSIGMNAAIKQLQKPIVDWKWSCTKMHRLEGGMGDVMRS